MPADAEQTSVYFLSLLFLPSRKVLQRALAAVVQWVNMISDGRFVGGVAEVLPQRHAQGSGGSELGVPHGWWGDNGGRILRLMQREHEALLGKRRVRVNVAAWAN